jgi:ATP diphosphatase
VPQQAGRSARTGPAAREGDVTGTDQTATIALLLGIMRRLRDPASGCPWDLQQDFRSIAPYTLEEAYEVVDAIESGTPEGLQDELGDLLFQVVFHAQLASEAGWFRFEDVVRGICEKMVHRHPHVFADDRVEDVEAQTRVWEDRKQEERGAQQSLLDGVPVALPSLTRARKLQQRAARAGFDWREIGGVFDKVAEELEELRTALTDPADRDSLQEEAGDLLFAVVNLLRHAGVDPEAALRAGNRKFERRFRDVEARCARQGSSVAETGADVLEEHWQAVKEAEREGPVR